MEFGSNLNLDIKVQHYKLEVYDVIDLLKSTLLPILDKK